MVKTYHQARESAGIVDVLCFKCRRTPGKCTQSTIFGSAAPSGLFCSRCRRPLETTAGPKKTITTPPQVTRLKAYKRLATQNGVPFALTDSQAFAIMRQDCVGCGARPGPDLHGLSRLRDWTGFDPSTARKGFMGPFSLRNVVPACATCNLMKGYRSIASFVEACRTIATRRTGDDFGSFPGRFRNNISKRSRSAYITQSSTHTKTHALTNKQFNAIVACPCHYCGKPSDPPRHYNGLDRLENNDRVYTVDTVVSCCGDCNVMKYKHSESFFVDHCTKVALHHVGTQFEHDDEDDDVEPEDPPS